MVLIFPSWLLVMQEFFSSSRLMFLIHFFVKWNCFPHHWSLALWLIDVSLARVDTMKLYYPRISLKDYLQISLLILSELKWIKQLLFPLKSSENQRFSDDFRRNRSQSIRFNSLNIRSEIWRWFLEKLFPIYIEIQAEKNFLKVNSRC